MTPLDDLLTADAKTARSSVIREILALVDLDDVLSLAGGMPDPATFPVDDLARVADAAIRSPSGEPLQYGRTEGMTPLRAVIADDAASRRSRACTPDEVLVTTGSQQALDLVGRAFLDPGDEVAIDDPGYLGAIQALGARHPRWLPIRVDDDGLDTEALEAALTRGGRPKLVYTVTDFQNPTGAVLHPERRRHLAALADHWGFLVVEDDPYGRIRFDEPVHPPVSTWTDRAISLGTTSKTIAPGLRVGWMVAPPPLITVLARLKQATDLHTSTLSQQLVLDLLAVPGWMTERSKVLGAFYRERAGELRAALAEALPGATIAEPRGGLFLWADIPGVDTTALLPRAVDAGVAFVPGSAFRTGDDPTSTFRATYATLGPTELREAARRLGSVV
ncbi:PLP-dependent aminotransferase family protein [Actinospongicola halichondriae]|uniref:aminotransferase-like domain-containing protein n=1 Tax=Actinospongicola halichondriae TaxID=3236844 RepID=UPI003D38B690